MPKGWLQLRIDHRRPSGPVDQYVIGVNVAVDESQSMEKTDGTKHVDQGLLHLLPGLALEILIEGLALDERRRVKGTLLPRRTNTTEVIDSNEAWVNEIPQGEELIVHRGSELEQLLREELESHLSTHDEVVNEKGRGKSTLTEGFEKTIAAMNDRWMFRSHYYFVQN